jgi:hypothetical protein
MVPTVLTVLTLQKLNFQFYNSYHMDFTWCLFVLSVIASAVAIAIIGGRHEKNEERPVYYLSALDN